MNKSYLFFFLITVFACPVGVSAQLPYPQLPENKTWIFGTGAGMDFNLSTPTAIASNNVEMSATGLLGSGTASASDETGKLLLYATMDTIKDKSGNSMPNARGLLKNPPTATYAYFDGGALIVPLPGDTNKYYVFSQTTVANNSVLPLSTTYLGIDPVAGRLYYSLVDMTLNGGLGDVVPGKKGIQIDSMLSDRLVAIAGPSCNIWLVCMKNDGSEMHSFDISAAGINTAPVVSPCSITAGSMDISPLFQSAGGCMKSSSDGSKLAVSLAGVVLDFNTFSFYGGHFQLYDFNAITGRASNQLNVLEPSGLLTFDQQIMNLCFSSDNKKVYTTHGLLLGTGLAQFDVSSGVVTTIVASKVELNPTGDIGALTGIRLAADDKVYIAGTSILGLFPGTTLHRINSPNTAGIGAGLILNAVNLTSGAYASFGLGNATVRRPPIDTAYNPVTKLLICAPDEDITLMPGIPEDTGSVYEWEDGSKGYSRKITLPGKYRVVYGPRCPKVIDSFIVLKADARFDLGPDSLFCGNWINYPVFINVPGASYLWQDGSRGNEFKIQKAGQYYVKTELNGCTWSDTVTIDLVDVSQDLGADTIVCAKTPFEIALRANMPLGSSVLWSTGAIEDEIRVTSPGEYTVTVTDRICIGTDAIRIDSEMCDCITFLPTAFSPNNDAINDVFAPLFESGCPIANYNLIIFNRFGQLLFNSTVPETGWNGTWKGKTLDAGSYMFSISYEKGTLHHKYVQKGDLTLVR